MRQLSNVESALLLLGGLLMVVGSGASLFLQSWAPYVPTRETFWASSIFPI